MSLPAPGQPFVIDDAGAEGILMNGAHRLTGFEPAKIPSDYNDSDILDVILTDLEWQEEGLPDAGLTGWWSMKLEPAASEGADES